ncbi:MAG TPA: hypothetical protein VKA44_03725 [Gemmatimonadota bacterium]|nr:hypothetical protein [Gemmatimonadota bacterium]
MAKTIEGVMKMVERELDRDPDISNEALYEKARKVDGSIGDLTLRQFHARYPLQVKRRRAAASGPKKKKSRSRATSRSRGTKAASGDGPDREAIRDVLLRLAREVSAAEGKAAMIDLVVGLDRFVDEVVKAADGSHS